MGTRRGPLWEKDKEKPKSNQTYKHRPNIPHEEQRETKYREIGEMDDTWMRTDRRKLDSFTIEREPDTERKLCVVATN